MLPRESAEICANLWFLIPVLQAIRPKTPLSLEDARRVVGEFVEHYNTVRLHSALGYITPRDRLEGRHTEIYAMRDRKLETAREVRKKNRATLEFAL